MGQWHLISWSKVVKFFNSNEITGLNNLQIDEQRNRYGDNKISIGNSKNLFKIILKLISNIWMIYSLMIVLYSFYSRNYTLGIISFILTTITFAFLLKEELYIYKDSEIFNKFNTYTANVLRGGIEEQRNFEEIVCGDIIYFKKGDIAAADIRIINADNLKIRETTLTGNSELIEKYSTRMDEDVQNMQEIKNIIFKGSSIMEGEGYGIVIATGEKTQMGKILEHMKAASTHRTSFFNGINKVLNIFPIVSLIAIAIFIAKDYYVFRKISFESFEMVYIFPQSIILCMLIFWLVYEITLEKREIKINDISSLPRLSTVNTIIMNKIGAFSQNYYIALDLYTDGEYVTNTRGIQDNYNLERMMEIAILCNNGKYKFTEDGFEVKGKMSDVALLKFARKNEARITEIKAEHQRVLFIPSDNSKKIETSVNEVDGNFRAYVKGSLSEIIEKSTHIMKKGVEIELTVQDKLELKDRSIEMASRNLETIALAYRNFKYEPSEEENIESHLVLVGIIGLENPEKEYISYQIEQGEIAAIKPILITEENKLTSFTFGKNLKIINDLGQIVSGVELENTSKSEFDAVVDRSRMFSLISYDQKHAIVSSLKKSGRNIAVTGSTLSDIPAFQEGDISFSVGEKCSNIAKKTSDIFLASNNYGVMTRLILESRKILSTFEKIIMYSFSYIVAVTLFIITSKLLLGDFVYNGAVFYLVTGAFTMILIFMLLKYKSLEIVNHNEYYLEKSTITVNISTLTKRGISMILVPIVLLVILKIDDNYKLFFAILLLNINTILSCYKFIKLKDNDTWYIGVLHIINIAITALLMINIFNINIDIAFNILKDKYYIGILYLVSVLIIKLMPKIEMEEIVDYM